LFGSPERSKPAAAKFIRVEERSAAAGECRADSGGCANGSANGANTAIIVLGCGNIAVC